MINSVMHDIVRKGSRRMALMGDTLLRNGEDYFIDEVDVFDKEEKAIIRAVTEGSYVVVVRAGKVMLVAPAHEPNNQSYAGEVMDVKEYIKYIKNYAPEDWVTKASGNSLFISILCREALAGTLDRFIK